LDIWATPALHCGLIRIASYPSRCSRIVLGRTARTMRSRNCGRDFMTPLSKRWSAQA